MTDKTLNSAQAEAAHVAPEGTTLKQFVFPFRRTAARNLETLMADGLSYADFEYIKINPETEKEELVTAAEKDSCDFIRRKQVTITVPVTTLEKVISDPKGSFILTKLLEDYMFSAVRKDFDNAPAGQLPADYAVTVAYLVDCMTPSASGSTKRATIKASLLQEICKSFAGFLTAAGKKPAAVQYQINFLRQKFDPAIMATINPDNLTAITSNIVNWADSLNDAEMTAYGEAAEILQANLLAAHDNAEEVSADDL